MYRTVVGVFLLLVLSTAAFAQVEVFVPSNTFKPEEVIQAKVTNKSSAPVSYCVEFGQTSPHGETVVNTPLPFYVEKRGTDKWGVLLIGPDVGSSRHPIILDSGASQDFPFRLIDTGKMRLVLRYWVGERDDVCNESAKDKRTAKSTDFSVVKQ
jgi:hypothetical protein